MTGPECEICGSPLHEGHLPGCSEYRESAVEKRQAFGVGLTRTERRAAERAIAKVRRRALQGGKDGEA